MPKRPYVLDLIQPPAKNYLSTASTLTIPQNTVVTVPFNVLSSDVSSSTIKIPTNASSCVISIVVKYYTSVALAGNYYGLTAQVQFSPISSTILPLANFTPFETPPTGTLNSKWATISMLVPLNGTGEDGTRTMKLAIVQDPRNTVSASAVYVMEVRMGNIVFFY